MTIVVLVGLKGDSDLLELAQQCNEHEILVGWKS